MSKIKLLLGAQLFIMQTAVLSSSYDPISVNLAYSKSWIAFLDQIVKSTIIMHFHKAEFNFCHRVC